MCIPCCHVLIFIVLCEWCDQLAMVAVGMCRVESALSRLEGGE